MGGFIIGLNIFDTTHRKKVELRIVVLVAEDFGIVEVHVPAVGIGTMIFFRI